MDMDAFKSFRSHCLRRIQSVEDHYLQMAEHHQKYLPSFRDNLDVMRTCVAHNHEIIKLMLQGAEVMFENKNHTIANGDDNPHLKAMLFYLDKVKLTIKQVYRDWSKAGKEERDACYLPVLSAVERRFPPTQFCGPATTVEIDTPTPLLGVVRTDTPTPTPLLGVVRTDTSTPLHGVVRTDTPTPIPLLGVVRTDTPTPLLGVVRTDTPTPLLGVVRTDTPTPIPPLGVVRTDTPTPTPLQKKIS